MRQVYNLTSSLVPWMRFLWFLTQQLVSGEQSNGGTGRELERSVHVDLRTLVEACQESLNIVEALSRLAVEDVSPLPARHRRVCCHLFGVIIIFFIAIIIFIIICCVYCNPANRAPAER